MTSERNDDRSAPREVLLGASEWARSSYRTVSENGWDGVEESARELATRFWQLYGMVHNYGTPIYEREWDVLVVLDACRADLLAEVEAEYEFLNRETTDSVASVSAEWMEKNFIDEYADEMRRTAHVTANPFSRYCLDEADFSLLDEVWRYGWDDDRGTVLPDVVTERGIRVAREHDPDRLILHYMQPHHPFVPNPLDEGMVVAEDRSALRNGDSVWVRLQRGEVSESDVWDAYRANLEYVLESVEILLGSVDAETVAITADHGNAVGERGVYGHPKYVPIEPLKRVPWCVTSATDEGAFERSSIEPVDGAAPGPNDAGEVEGKLEALGYL